MKGIRKIVVGVLVLTFLLSLAGCMPMQSKTEQFTDGLVRLMSTPLDMLADAKEPTYSDDLVGELLELTNTRSHNTSASLQIDRLSGIESMGFGLGMLSGARFDFESAYDVETGDGVIDFYGLGLISGKLAVHENAAALDIANFLPQMLILEYESALDYGGDIPLLDRMADLSNALNAGGGSMKDLPGDVRLVLEDYSGVLQGVLDEDQISRDSEKMDVMGKNKKVQVLTLDMTEVDVEEILGTVLEYAQDDPELADLVVKYAVPLTLAFGDNLPSSGDELELRESFADSIRISLTDLDYLVDLWGAMDVTMQIYYTYEGFLADLIPGLPFVQSREPVAVGLSINGEAMVADLFWKFVEDGENQDVVMDLTFNDGESQGYLQVDMQSEGRAYVLSAAGDMDNGDSVFSVEISNVLEGDTYLMDGVLSLSANGEVLTADIQGETQVESDQEIREITVSGNYQDGRGATTLINATINNTLRRLQRGSDYERASDISAAFTVDGETITADISMETSYEFSDDVVVDLPDFDDQNAIRVTDVESLIDMIKMMFGFGFGF